MKKCKDHPNQDPYVQTKDQPKCWQCMWNNCAAESRIDYWVEEEKVLFGKEQDREVVRGYFLQKKLK